MSINIGRFVTHCRAARQHQAVGSLADQIVRNRFGTECSRRLSLMPVSQGSVVRIRKLPVKLKISAAKLDEESITEAWVEAFIGELLIAVKTNRINDGEIVCVNSRAEWLARFIADVLSGSANGRWEYEEFRESLQLGTSHCVLSVLSLEPLEIVPVLRLLEECNRFEQFLLLFDDFLLEKFFSLFSPVNEAEPTVDDLITIARLVTSQNISRGILGTRQRSLRIFLALCRMHVESDRVMSPRLVWYALLTLDKLVELTQTLPQSLHQSLAFESWFKALSPESIAQQKETALHPVVLEVIAKIWSLTTSGMKAESRKLQTLSRLVADLDPVRTADKTPTRSRWVSSQFAGLLLLVGLIDRLGWVQRIRGSSLALRFDTGAINFCLAALALRLVGQSPENRRPDTALLLFAGWLEPAAINLNAFHNFLHSLSENERVDLLELLAEVDTQQKEDAKVDWTATFDALASILIREFAGRVRGFRQANPAFVVKTFLSQPGRVFIDDQRILVVLQSNPFHVALHVSSIDEPVESVSWLGGRRLEFQLEGL
jgi:hypothetical protein